MAKQDDYARYTVRLPADLYARIQALATLHERSVNSEIISMLQLALEIAEYDGSGPAYEPLADDDPDRLALIVEDEKHRAIERNRVLARHGVDNVLADVVARLESIERKLDDAPTITRTPSAEDDARILAAQKAKKLD